MRNKIEAGIKKRAAEKAAKGDSPRGYDSRYANVAMGLMLMGKDQNDVARVLGVSASTISNWKNKHPDFAEALLYGREQAGAEEAATAHLLAVGQYVHKDKIMVYDSKKNKIVTREVREKLPPDSGLLKFMLPRHAPEHYPDKQEISLDFEGIDVNISLKEEG